MITDDIVYYKKNISRCVWVRWSQFPSFQGTLKRQSEKFNTSTVPRFFFLSMVRLPWCDGEDRPWQQAAPAQVRCAWQIHLSGWWFQNVSDVLWHVYPISQQWDDWSPNSSQFPNFNLQIFGEQKPTTSWNLILNRCGLNSVVHEHVE